MSGRRLLKAAEAIREVVSMSILTELRDPRVKHVTVVGVEVTPDMREAKVFVSIMGNESQQRTTLNGLMNSRGFLQTRIAERIDTRYTPKLSFVMDEGVKKSVVVQQILEQIARERTGNESPNPNAPVEDPSEYPRSSDSSNEEIDSN
jgi:ribosome-binding factor A